MHGFGRPYSHWWQFDLTDTCIKRQMSYKVGPTRPSRPEKQTWACLSTASDHFDKGSCELRTSSNQSQSHQSLPAASCGSSLRCQPRTPGIDTCELAGTTCWQKLSRKPETAWEPDLWHLSILGRACPTDAPKISMHSHDDDCCHDEEIAETRWSSGQIFACTCQGGKCIKNYITNIIYIWSNLNFEISKVITQVCTCHTPTFWSSKRDRCAAALLWLH